MQSKRTTVYRHADLTRLLHPASVAVVGASTRAGSFGERVLVNLQHYGGRVYPVNARYERIGDQRCYPNVNTLPEVPDCAVVTAPREAVEEIVLECAAAGVGGVIVFASGYAETGKEDRIAQQQRLAAIARESNMRIVGPNCIGVVNAPLDMRVTFMDITPIPPPRRHSIGMVSQSGALGMALAQAVVRGVSFSHVLTSGNSCDVDMADYISYLADDPSCAAIACVFEGMAEPERMLIAAESAWQRDKPLIVFKMATGEQGAAAAMSHTGSLAGSQAAYRAVFRRAGAILVDDYEALCETAAFFAKAKAPKARGVAVVAASGGAAIMAADRAEQFDVPLTQPSDAVRDVLLAHIPEFGSARNPCDVTAQILANPEIAQRLRRCTAWRCRVRCVGGTSDLRLRTFGEAHSGLRFAGGQARQDRVHRLAERVAGRARREGGGRGGACCAVPLDAFVLCGVGGVALASGKARCWCIGACRDVNRDQAAGRRDDCRGGWTGVDRTRGEGGAGAVRRAGGW